jgi:CHAT domain-containing protein/tetratricopeptide (TPR) repeat protein
LDKENGVRRNILLLAILCLIFISFAPHTRAASTPVPVDKRIEMYNAGSALLDAGENNKAVQFFESTLKENPGLVEAAEGLIEARSRLCMSGAAIAFCERTLDSLSGPQLEIFRLYLSGAKARLERKFSDAAVYFQNATAAAERDKDFLSGAIDARGRARCLLASQEGALALEAAEQFRNLLSTLPASNRLFAEAAALEAECCGATDRITAADSLYRETLSRAREKSYRRVESLCLAGLGRLEDNRERYKAAEEYYARSLSLEQSMGGSEKIAILHNDLGQVEVRRGALEAAAEHFKRGEEIARSCHLTWILGYLSYGSGALAEAKGDNEEALKLFQQSIALHKESGDARGELGAHLRLGYLRGALGEYTKAIRQYEYSLKRYEDMKDLHGLSRTLEGLALAHHKLGNSKKAEEYYLRTLDVKRQLGDKNGAAWSLSSLGMIADMQGRYRDALSYEHEAMLIYEELGDGAGAAEAQYGMGSVYYYLGNYREAWQQYEAAYAIAEKVGNRELLGKIVCGMSSAYSSAGRLDLAESLSEKYLALARSSREKGEIVRALNYCASVRIQLGNHEAARSSLHEALDLLPAQGQEPLRARTLYLLAQASLSSGVSSIEYLERALALAEGSGVEELKWKCLTDLGDLYLAQGDTAKSYSLQHRAIVSVESLRRFAGSDELQRHFMRPASVPYERIVSLILTRSRRAADVKEAFSYTERCRAQILASLLREAMDRAGTKGDDKLLERERDILTRLTFYQARLKDGTISPGERSGLLSKIGALEQRFVSLSISLERGDKIYVEALYPKVEQPDELLSALALDERVLSYFLGERRSYVFYGKDKELRAYELPPRRIIEQKAEYFLNLLLQLAETKAEMPAGSGNAAPSPAGPAPLKQAFDLASSELFDILLGPAAKDFMPGDKIIIIPDGFLGKLPFALLKKGPRYFVENHDISYAPSLRTLRYLRERNGIRGRSKRIPEYNVIAVGASGESAAPGETAGSEVSPSGVYPFTDIPIEPLRHAAEEAKDVASIFARTRILTGRSAEESVFKGNPLDDTGILHLAAHAYIDDVDLRRSFIVLNPEWDFGDTLASPAEDGLLQWHEVAALKLNATLVTLSACRSTGGALSSGAGITGLAQAFLYAGGGCIVAAQFDVPDELVGPMMREYYRNVRKGLGAAAALSAAQRSALAGNDALARPAVWGAFVAIGDGASAPRLSREVTRPMYLAFALLAVAGVIIVLNMLKRRR